MKIESIIQRQHGTKITLGTQDYHFAPGEDGRHVCEVEDESHIDRLLSIKEGFRAVEDEAPAGNSAPAAPVVPDAIVPKAEAKAKPEVKVKPKGSRRAKAAVPNAEAPAGNSAPAAPAEPAADATIVAKADGEA